MEITLRYLSSPNFQSGVAREVGVHQSTVSNVLADVLPRIAAKSADWIRFPQDAVDVLEAKQAYYTATGFPSAIGAVDCTHVPIDKPAGPFPAPLCGAGVGVGLLRPLTQLWLLAAEKIFRVKKFLFMAF